MCEIGNESEHIIYHRPKYKFSISTHVKRLYMRTGIFISAPVFLPVTSV
jgi:hypothetical protein